MASSCVMRCCLGPEVSQGGCFCVAMPAGGDAAVEHCWGCWEAKVLVHLHELFVLLVLLGLEGGSLRFLLMLSQLTVWILTVYGAHGVLASPVYMVARSAHKGGPTTSSRHHLRCNTLATHLS